MAKDTGSLDADLFAMVRAMAAKVDDMHAARVQEAENWGNVLLLLSQIQKLLEDALKPTGDNPLLKKVEEVLEGVGEIKEKQDKMPAVVARTVLDGVDEIERAGGQASADGVGVPETH